MPFENRWQYACLAVLFSSHQVHFMAMVNTVLVVKGSFCFLPHFTIAVPRFEKTKAPNIGSSTYRIDYLGLFHLIDFQEASMELRNNLLVYRYN